MVIPPGWSINFCPAVPPLLRRGGPSWLQVYSTLDSCLGVKHAWHMTSQLYTLGVHHPVRARHAALCSLVGLVAAGLVVAAIALGYAGSLMENAGILAALVVAGTAAGSAAYPGPCRRR
jgi:hypothetical protein